MLEESYEIAAWGGVDVAAIERTKVAFHRRVINLIEFGTYDLQLIMFRRIHFSDFWPNAFNGVGVVHLALIWKNGLFKMKNH